ncbi:MAG TPA: hypothetical protein VG456_28030 [Candidatus Sulfopaludibacter sp.]|nr:hypothetical protein [Candidatus Sulfopaludibacter sp.]
MDVVLFLAGFLSTGIQFHTARFGTGFETFTLARNLVDSGTFSNPFGVNSGPSAHLAPLFPFFLAMLIRIFGNGAGFAVAISFATLAAHGLHAALLPRLSDLFFRDRRPGMWAALIATLLPVLYFFPHSEGIFCAVGLMLFCLVTDRRLSRGGSGGALFTGLFAGLLTLLNPTCLLVCTLWVAYLLWRGRVAFASRSTALIALAYLVTLTPWTVRNYQEFHKLFFIRDNLGMELCASNNDVAQPTMLRNLDGGLHLYHPITSPSEARLIQQVGEWEYNRLRMKTAVEWIRSHPARFFTLTLLRFCYFWFPDSEGVTPVHGAGIACLTLSTLISLGLMLWRKRPIAVFVTAVLAIYPALYYLVAIDPRYRTPILWVSLLGAGYLLWSALLAVQRRPVAQSIRSGGGFPHLHLLE